MGGNETAYVLRPLPLCPSLSCWSRYLVTAGPGRRDRIEGAVIPDKFVRRGEDGTGGRCDRLADQDTAFGNQWACSHSRALAIMARLAALYASLKLATKFTELMRAVFAIEIERRYIKIVRSSERRGGWAQTITNTHFFPSCRACLAFRYSFPC